MSSYRVLNRPQATLLNLFMAYLLALLMVSGISCYPDKAHRNRLSATHSFTLLVKDPATAQLIIENTGPESALFSIKLNNRFFLSEKDMIEEIRRMPDEYENEPLEQKAWRYVIAHVNFSKPITPDNWQHAPMLMINSIGTGLCDDLSATLSLLWKALGFQSRVWTLEGHVVPEVLVNGKWHMYDPLYQVYYLNNANEIAGVEELSNHPELITQLHNKQLPPKPAALPYALAHTKKIAGIYGSYSDNNVNNWFDEKTQTDTLFRLPPGAVMKLPAGYEGTDNSVVMSLPPDHALLSVQIKPNSISQLHTPLVVWAIEGKGKVSIGHKEFDINTKELNDYLQRFTGLHQQLMFKQHSNVTIYYLLNRNAIAFYDTSTLVVHSTATGNINASIQYTNKATVNSTEKPDSIALARFAVFDKKMEQNHMQAVDFFTGPTTIDNVYERIALIIDMQDGLTARQKIDKTELTGSKLRTLIETLPGATQQKKLFAAISDPHVFIMLITYLEYSDIDTILKLIA